MTRTGIREAYTSVSGQNSNNTVRVTDEFLKAVLEDRDWNLTYRGSGKIAKTVQGARTVGQGFLCRLGLRRSGHPVPHHHQ